MEGLTVKQGLNKGRTKVCAADKCNQISKQSCEKCLKPSCKYHMCARFRNKKKMKICDKCNYAEIRDQIEAENQKEKKMGMEKLASMKAKNKESYEKAKNDQTLLREYEEKIEKIMQEAEIKSQVKLEEIKKEQSLKEGNLNVLANLKAAIEGLESNYKTENEKLVQAKSDASTLQIDINEINAEIKDKQARLKTLKETAENSISYEEAGQKMCHRCFAKAKGYSILKSVSVIQSHHDENSKACKCLII